MKWKQGQIKDLLKRIAGVDVEVNPTIASPKEYNYRSKITPHYPKPAPDREFPIGFLMQGTTRRIVDVPQCPIAIEAINRALPGARDKVIESKPQLKRGGTLLIRKTLEGIVTDNKARVSEKVGDLTFYFNAGEFFQNNPYILPKMVSYAIEQAKADGVEYLIDSYSGVGVFALNAAKDFKQVMGVEVSAKAVSFAKKNAQVNGIENCDFIEGESEAIFAEVEFPEEKTAVIIDPPRKGCDPEFLNQLIAYAPQRVVYISCEPSTQARDMVAFLDSGYRIEAVQPFDLFPQTRHIESVVTLVKA